MMPLAFAAAIFAPDRARIRDDLEGVEIESELQALNDALLVDKVGGVPKFLCPELGRHYSDASRVVGEGCPLRGCSLTRIEPRGANYNGAREREGMRAIPAALRAAAVTMRWEGGRGSS